MRTPMLFPAVRHLPSPQSRSFTAALLASALVLAPLAATAASIYRWVDAKGQVHYGEAPPAGVDAQAQAQQPRPRSSAPAARPAPPPSLPPPGALAAANGKPAAPPAASAAADKETRAKNCKAAKDHIEMLETRTARRILLEQKDGSVSRMTDEEFEKSLADAKKSVATNC